MALEPENQNAGIGQPAGRPVPSNLRNRVVGGVICLVALVMAWNSVRSLSAQKKLVQDGVTTNGVITSRQPGMHGVVDYAFTAEGKEYRGSGVGPGQREYGKTVTVFYSRSDPSVSSLHPPLGRTQWPLVIVPLVISCYAFCLAMGWIELKR